MHNSIHPRPAQQGGPGGPWPTQFSGQVVFFDLSLHRDIEHRGNIERSAQSIDTHTRTHDRVIASFPGAWE